MWVPETEPREGAQLLLYPAPWHRLNINSVAAVSAEVSVIQLEADEPNVSHSMVSPSLSSFSQGCCYYLHLFLRGCGGYRGKAAAKAASF